jgi:hypothetical protein
VKALTLLMSLITHFQKPTAPSRSGFFYFQMAKDLTYFKFVVSEWNDGDITTCSYAAQGLFVNLCSLYWSREGNLTLEKAQKKLPRARKSVWDELICDGVVKIIDGKLSINFLDEQLNELDSLSIQNSNNAKTGWKRRKKDAPAFSRKPSASFSQSENDAEVMPKNAIYSIVDKNIYIHICESVCALFGRSYESNPELRLPNLSQWYSDIEYQVNKLLETWSADIALKQVNAYKKYCEENNRKKIGTLHKVADTIQQADWLTLTNASDTAPQKDPYSEARHNRSLWTKKAWETRYDHLLKTDNNFRKSFGYEEL